jgi:hypothetical protein
MKLLVGSKILASAGGVYNVHESVFQLNNVPEKVVIMKCCKNVQLVLPAAKGDSSKGMLQC